MNAYITAACRSAVMPRDGGFAALSIEELAAPVIQSVIARAGVDPCQVDELILSNALGAGGNPARRAALAAGLPQCVAGLSIDRQCAGGLDAILLARAMVSSGAARVVVAGGVESYSRRPMRLRTFADGRAPEPYAQAPFTPWPDRDPDMAEAAEALAQAQGISRSAQDDWAIASHAKAMAAERQEGEVIPLAGQSRDAFARRLTAQTARRAKPIVGSITAANTAVAADAAAFVVVTADAHPDGLRMIGGATRGADPLQPGLAPLVAMEDVLDAAGLRAGDLTVAEVMEAYAVQAIACVRGARLDPARVNLGGGALARGHPIGASGAINTVRLFHELRRRGGTGLATIASAGGIGSALLLGA
ncbi:MAG: acetyl-CoA C-acyltransferase [Pseudomonadota bacterium]